MMLMKVPRDVYDNLHPTLPYAVDACNKGYEFWQEDSLAVHLFSKEMAYQKLDYIHYNPCTEYWQLAKEPIDYLFSSEKYY